MKQKPFSRSDVEAQFGSLSASESKKKLADYALKHYDVKLSRQKSFTNMMNDLEEELSSRFEEARAEVGDAKEQIDLLERVDLTDAVEIDPDKMDLDEDLELPEPEIVQSQMAKVVSINDIPKEDKERIVEIIKSGAITIEAPFEPIPAKVPEEIVEKHPEITITFPSNYQPKYKLVGPEGRAFINVPYWIYDWMQGRQWRLEISYCPYDKELLKSLAYYIERDGSVAIRESRNSKFIVIS